MANTEAIPNALDYEHKAARVVTVLELTLETACAWAYLTYEDIKCRVLRRNSRTGEPTAILRSLGGSDVGLLTTPRDGGGMSPRRPPRNSVTPGVLFLVKLSL